MRNVSRHMICIITVTNVVTPGPDDNSMYIYAYIYIYIYTNDNSRQYVYIYIYILMICIYIYICIYVYTIIVYHSTNDHYTIRIRPVRLLRVWIIVYNLGYNLVYALGSTNNRNPM